MIVNITGNNSPIVYSGTHDEIIGVDYPTVPEIISYALSKLVATHDVHLENCTKVVIDHPSDGFEVHFDPSYTPLADLA